MAASTPRSDTDRTLVPSPPMTDASGIVWRRIEPGVWVGRLDGRHVGTIARGRRYTLIDGEEHLHPDFATLVEAQAATASIRTVPAVGGAPDVDDPDLPRGATRAMVIVTVVAIAASLGALGALIDLGFRLLLLS